MDERTEKFYDVLKDSIDTVEADYIDYLHNPSELSVAEFQGLLLTIYSKVFRPTKIVGNRHNLSILDIDNADDIIYTWDLYTTLCNRYNKTLSVVQYASFVGIDYDWFYRIVSNRRKIINQTILQAVKKIFRDAESVTYGQAVDGNRIGAIFALKSKFGYTDSKPQEIIIHNGAQLSASEIQNKYLDLLPDNSTAQITDNSDTQKARENVPEMAN